MVKVQEEVKAHIKSIKNFVREEQNVRDEVSVEHLRAKPEQENSLILRLEPVIANLYPSVQAHQQCRSKANQQGQQCARSLSPFSRTLR